MIFVHNSGEFKDYSSASENNMSFCMFYAKKGPSWSYNIEIKALNYRPIKPRNQGFISFNQLKEPF